MRRAYAKRAAAKRAASNEDARYAGHMGHRAYSTSAVRGSYRPVLFDIAPAGQNLVTRVILYEDTWHNHIVGRHPEMNGNLHLIEAVLSAPSAIYEGTSTSTIDYLFVRAGVADSAGRSLRVVVRSGGVVITAYFTSATGGSRLWP